MNKKGIVLIVVMGFLLLLTSAVIQFHQSCSLRTRNLRKMIDSVQAKYLSETGIFIGKEIIANDKSPSYDWIGEDWAKEKTINLNAGKIHIIIEDERSKVNLSEILKPGGKLNTKLLKIAKNLFVILGYPESTLDSFLDWIDEDKLPKSSGAEDMYYAAFNPPYQPPNKNLLSLRELGLIKGFTKELLYGKKEENIPGLLNFVTIYSDSTISTININTCSSVILQALGFNEVEVEQLLNEREEKPLTEKDLITINKEAYLTNKNLITYESKFFSVVSEGITDTGLKVMIKAVIKIENKDSKIIRIEYL